MAIPEEDQITSQDLVVVSPHEVVQVQNVELPDTYQEEKRLVEAEKQIDEVIGLGMDMLTTGKDDIPGLEPKFRSRHIEVMATIYGNVVGAIKLKEEVSFKKIKLKMEQQNFSSKKTGRTDVDPQPGAPKSITNNVFFSGDRETLKKLAEEGVLGMMGDKQPETDK